MSPTNQPVPVDYVAIASLAASIASVIVALLVGFLTIRIYQSLKRIAERELTLTAYNNAVQGIVGIKQVFADKPATFEKYLAPSLRQAIPSSMYTEEAKPDVPVFLAFAGSIWRFSYVYSVMSRGELLGLRPEECKGLDDEMKLWLQNVPGFKDVFNSHTSVYRAHNRDFLKYLATEVYPDEPGSRRVLAALEEESRERAKEAHFETW